LDEHDYKGAWRGLEVMMRLGNKRIGAVEGVGAVHGGEMFRTVCGATTLENQVIDCFIVYKTRQS